MGLIEPCVNEQFDCCYQACATATCYCLPTSCLQLADVASKQASMQAYASPTSFVVNSLFLYDFGGSSTQLVVATTGPGNPLKSIF
jgi:hypothetical protein